MPKLVMREKREREREKKSKRIKYNRINLSFYHLKLKNHQIIHFFVFSITNIQRTDQRILMIIVLIRRI